MVGTCWKSVWNFFNSKHDPCALLSTISTVQHNFSRQNASPRKGGSTWQSCRPWICTLLRRLGGWSLNVSTAPAAGKSKRSSCNAGRVSKPPPKNQRKLIDFGILFSLIGNWSTSTHWHWHFKNGFYTAMNGCYGVSKWVWEKRLSNGTFDPFMLVSWCLSWSAVLLHAAKLKTSHRRPEWSRSTQRELQLQKELKTWRKPIETHQVLRKLSETESYSSGRKTFKNILNIWHVSRNNANPWWSTIHVPKPMHILRDTSAISSATKSVATILQRITPSKKSAKLQMRQGMHFSPGQELMIFRQNFHRNNP